MSLGSPGPFPLGRVGGDHFVHSGLDRAGIGHLFHTTRLHDHSRIATFVVNNLKGFWRFTADVSLGDQINHAPADRGNGAFGYVLFVPFQLSKKFVDYPVRQFAITSLAIARNSLRRPVQRSTRWRHILTDQNRP